MSTDKKGRPPHGIYMRIDDFSNMLDVIGHVRKLAFGINQRSGYEKNMSVIEVGYTEQYAERVRDIIPIIQDQGLVAIVHGTFDPMGADGILADNIKDIAAARQALGADAIIGLSSHLTDSLKAAGQDIDYVVLDANASNIAQFKAKTNDVLCVARSKKGLTALQCEAVLCAGADFVDVGDYILKHKKGILQGTVNILHEIEKVSQSPKSVN